MSNTLAAIFPGQGSQQLGMLSELAEAFPIVQILFTKAAKVLGYDLWEIIQHGPLEKLSQTAITQPALLVAEYAIWCLWREKNGLLPATLAGHSLGEYTAWLCAESLDFESAVELVSKRGQYMQEAAPDGAGAMAAIVGLSDEEILELCKSAVLDDEILEPANFNSPGQVVVAGHRRSVLNIITLAEQLPHTKLAKELNVSVPCHCRLMLPAANRLTTFLESLTINPPKIPVLNNVDVAYYDDPIQIKDALIRQLYNPVRWVETIKTFKTQGITHVIEIGPGRVLTGLNKRIERDLQVMPIYDPTTLSQALDYYNHSTFDRTIV